MSGGSSSTYMHTARASVLRSVHRCAGRRLGLVTKWTGTALTRSGTSTATTSEPNPSGPRAAHPSKSRFTAPQGRGSIPMFVSHVPLTLSKLARQYGSPLAPGRTSRHSPRTWVPHGTVTVSEDQPGVETERSWSKTTLPVSYTHLRAHETPEHLV